MSPAVAIDRTHPASCSCRTGPADWYVCYSAMIRRYLLVRYQDSQAAEECTSETFARAIARRESFRCGGDGVRPWLFTIARNIASDYERKAWRRYEVPIGVLAEDTDARPTPEQALLRSVAYRELHGHIQRLPEDQATCVWLRFFAGLSVEQTARAMRRNNGALRALQYRAIRKLAHEMGAPYARDPADSRPLAA